MKTYFDLTESIREKLDARATAFDDLTKIINETQAICKQVIEFMDEEDIDELH